MKNTEQKQRSAFRLFFRIVFAFIVVLIILANAPVWAQDKQSNLVITTLFDNDSSNKELKTGWGYSCLIQGTEKFFHLAIYITIYAFSQKELDEKTKEKLKPYLSEEGAVRYLAKVEAALTRTLAKKGVCSKAIAEEVERASKRRFKIMK